MKTLNEKTPQIDETCDSFNKIVEDAYKSMIAKAINLIKGLEPFEMRTYCTMDHSKNELNSNLVDEFLCYFWNITLSKDVLTGNYCIDVDFGKEGLVKYGNALSNLLLIEIYTVIQSSEEPTDSKFPLFVNLMPIEHLTYWYSTIARGENEYITIRTIEPI